METQWLLGQVAQLEPFAVIPLELHQQIFRRLPTAALNSIRLVSKNWDFLVKEWFGSTVVLNNTNISMIPEISGCGELRVRNLTKNLVPCVANFPVRESLETVEISGMCQVGNLVALIQQFKGLETLKLNRLYLETDRGFALEPLRVAEQVKILKCTFLHVYKIESGLDPGNLMLARPFELTSSDISVLGTLDRLLSFDNLRVLDLRHVFKNADDRDARNGDVINWWGGGGVEIEGVEYQPSVIWVMGVSKLVVKALTKALKLETLRVDNCPCIVDHDEGGAAAELEEEEFEDGVEVEVMENGAAHRAPSSNPFEVLPRNLNCLEVDGGMLRRGWAEVLESLQNVKELKLVILDLNLLPSVKNAVNLSLRTLRVLELTVSNMHNIAIGVDQVRREAEEFDLAFLKQCATLRRLVVKYAGMKLKLTKLPMELEEVQVCGEVEKFEEFVQQSSRLKSLNLELSSGFFGDLPNDSSESCDLFSSVEKMEQLFLGGKNSTLETLVLTKYGARKVHRLIQRRFLKMAGVEIQLDEKVCKLRRTPAEQFELIMVPRISMKRRSLAN